MGKIIQGNFGAANSNSLNCTVILAAAGCGSRMALGFNKIFLSIEDNEDIADLSFKEADKLLLKFNFGTNITNPWDSDDIFDSIANIKKDTQKVFEYMKIPLSIWRRVIGDGQWISNPAPSALSICVRQTLL